MQQLERALVALPVIATPHALELRHLTPGKRAVAAAMGLRPETLVAVVATNCGTQEWDSDWLPGAASLHLLAPPSAERHNRRHVLLDVALAAGLTRHDRRDVLWGGEGAAAALLRRGGARGSHEWGHTHTTKSP